jgi:hypothetical protein
MGVLLSERTKKSSLQVNYIPKNKKHTTPVHNFLLNSKKVYFTHEYNILPARHTLPDFWPAADDQVA